MINYFIIGLATIFVVYVIYDARNIIRGTQQRAEIIKVIRRIDTMTGIVRAIQTDDDTKEPLIDLTEISRWRNRLQQIVEDKVPSKDPMETGYTSAHRTMRFGRRR